MGVVVRLKGCASDGINCPHRFMRDKQEYTKGTTHALKSSGASAGSPHKGGRSPAQTKLPIKRTSTSATSKQAAKGGGKKTRSATKPAYTRGIPSLDQLTPIDKLKGRKTSKLAGKGSAPSTVKQARDAPGTNASVNAATVLVHTCAK